MERRKFGDTGLEVSAVALGCWIFGVDWWGHYTQADCNRLCSFSMDQGVSFFDNGDAYGNGRAETLFGNWMKEAKIDRSKVEIGSKFGYDFYSDPGIPGSHSERKQDFSPRMLRHSLEQSLKRLQTDYIDLYMAHNIKLPQFRDDTFAELDKVKDEGKIKVWGVSLGPAIGWREEGIEAIMKHNAKAVQTVYNLFEQSPGREFCETARAYKAGVLARVHDNSSILKDVVKLDVEIDKNDHRKFRDNNWKVYGLKKLELVRPIAKAHDMTVHQLACKWLLMDPALTSITGTFLNEHEIKEAAESCDKPNLTKQEMEDLATNYARDWDLGPDAHPCNLKSSKDPSGQVRSQYIPPPVFVA
jgi:aryl-alcohol dehydrogenase-like predicted oxidoreductase